MHGGSDPSEPTTLSLERWTRVTQQTDMLTTAEVVNDLRAVILLAGRVGRNEFADGVGRSVLDLPVDANTTVLDRWIDTLDRFARAFALPKIHLRVAVDRTGTLPEARVRDAHPMIELEVVRDPEEYRGTAGLVKDLTKGYGEHDQILVATANQIQREPLRDVFQVLWRGDESVSIIPHDGGEFAGVFLLRCARLRDVSDVGFVDLKEQAIPSARGKEPLFVKRRAPGSTLPIRTLAEYIRALRLIHGTPNPDSFVCAPEDPFAETWQPVFSIVEPGAQVVPGAVLQDSVVLDGGRVEAGAVVTRSVVCAGGVVGRGQCVLETIVTP